jgi:hypothetical protein
MSEPDEKEEPEDEEHEEASREEATPARPSPKVIIIASLIVLILIIAAVYFIFFSGKELGSIAVGNIDKDSDKIEFPLYGTPSGMGDYTGEVTVEIYFDELDEPLYTNKVKINDGTGYEEVPYEEFVWDNGEYMIEAKGDGIVSSATFTINNVITAIQPEWTGVYPDSDTYDPEYFVDAKISYLFGERSYPSASYPQGYSFEGNILDPDGSSISLSSTLLSIEKRLEHNTKGTYTLSGTVTNTFCKSGSPYREVSVVSNKTYEHDAAPFSIAGDDVSIALSEGNAVVNFDGSGSWDDGTIANYEWDFGEEASSQTTIQPTIQHTYTSAGQYYVTLKVLDDSDQESLNGLASTMVVTVTDS